MSRNIRSNGSYTCVYVQQKTHEHEVRVDSEGWWDGTSLRRRWYWVGTHRRKGGGAGERLFAEWRINRLRVRGNTHRALMVCKMSRCLVEVARERNLMSHTPLHQATARRLYHSAFSAWRLLLKIYSLAVYSPASRLVPWPTHLFARFEALVYLQPRTNGSLDYPGSCHGRPLVAVCCWLPPLVAAAARRGRRKTAKRNQEKKRKTVLESPSLTCITHAALSFLMGRNWIKEKFEKERKEKRRKGEQKNVNEEISRRRQTEKREETAASRRFRAARPTRHETPRDARKYTRSPRRAFLLWFEARENAYRVIQPTHWWKSLTHSNT